MGWGTKGLCSYIRLKLQLKQCEYSQGSCLAKKTAWYINPWIRQLQNFQLLLDMYCTDLCFTACFLDWVKIDVIKISHSSWNYMKWNTPNYFRATEHSSEQKCELIWLYYDDSNFILLNVTSFVSLEWYVHTHSPHWLTFRSCFSVLGSLKNTTNMGKKWYSRIWRKKKAS